MSNSVNKIMLRPYPTQEENHDLYTLTPRVFWSSCNRPKTLNIEYWTRNRRITKGSFRHSL